MKSFGEKVRNWWPLILLLVSWVVWSLEIGSVSAERFNDLDKRVTVIESENIHSATKADLAPIKTSIAVIQNTVARIEKLQRDMKR